MSCQMNQKILVAYFTKSGATEEYAQKITNILIESGFTVDQINLSHEIPDISDFDTIILGTGVRMSMVYRRWKKIIKQKTINNKQLFMFLSSSMASEEPEKAVDKYLKPVVEKYNLKPVKLTSFPGKIPEKWAKYDDGPKGEVNLDLAKTWAEEIMNHLKKKH